MDIELETVELTKEEKENIEIEEKIDKGELKPSDVPLRYYLEHHQDFYLSTTASNFILNELQIKTIGELVNKYEDVVRPKIIERFPFFNELNMEEIDQFIADAAGDVFEMVDLNL